MKIGEMGNFIAAKLPEQSGFEQIGLARDREFQKFLDKASATVSDADLMKKGLKEEDRQLKEAAEQFEALFIFQTMQRMRATVMKGGLFEESMGEQVFRSMLDQEYSMKMAEAGKLGLAEMVYEQMKRK